MKPLILSLIIASVGIGLIIAGSVVEPLPNHARQMVISGLIALILGCFGLVLLWPEPPQARCAPPLRSSIL